MLENARSAVGNPTSALGHSGSSFGPSGLAPIGINHLLLRNLTTDRVVLPLVGAFETVVLSLLFAHVLDDSDENAFKPAQLVRHAALVQVLVHLANLILAAASDRQTSAQLYTARQRCIVQTKNSSDCDCGLCIRFDLSGKN